MNRLKKMWLLWQLWRTVAHDRELDKLYSLEKRRNAMAIKQLTVSLENFDLELRRNAIGSMPL